MNKMAVSDETSLVSSEVECMGLRLTLRDDGADFKLKPSSRRLVQRMTLNGKVINTYEFRDNGTTRLFTLPYRTTENCNSDICVVNITSEDTSELIALDRNGLVRFTYHGQGDCKFGPTDGACDSRGRMIVSDSHNKSLHMLSPDGTFLRYLLFDLVHKPRTIELCQDNMWIGFGDGTVIVYKYTTEAIDE